MNTNKYKNTECELCEERERQMVMQNDLFLYTLSCVRICILSLHTHTHTHHSFGINFYILATKQCPVIIERKKKKMM